MPIGGVQKRLRRIPRLSWSSPTRTAAVHTVTHHFFAETSNVPGYRRYYDFLVARIANIITFGISLRASREYGNQPRLIHARGKKKRMEIRNLVAGSAVALAMVVTPMAGVALGGSISPVGVASADGCGSGTGVGGGVWCAPPNTPLLAPEQVLKAAHQDAGGDLRDVGCQWPSCGPRWWPVKSPRPVG